MIELFDQDIKTNDRQSSKGNQLKWKSANTWYKADYTGYEGLAEYVISNLLKKSTLDASEFVVYELEQIGYKSVRYNGVKCENFLENNMQLITLERLFKNYFNQSLTESLWKIHDIKERFLFLTSQVERITGLSDFGIYLNKLLTIDALFLNEDRHMHNIAVLMDEDGRFKLCPIFDQGGSLLSDTTMDYPLDIDIFHGIDMVKSKTISQSFYEQLVASEEVCGTNIHFHFNARDIEEVTSAATIYDADIRNRVGDIILEQCRRYRYLFD